VVTPGIKTYLANASQMKDTEIIVMGISHVKNIFSNFITLPERWHLFSFCSPSLR